MLSFTHLLKMNLGNYNFWIRWKKMKWIMFIKIQVFAFLFGFLMYLLSSSDTVCCHCSDLPCYCVEDDFSNRFLKHSFSLHQIAMISGIKCLMTVKPIGRLGNLMGEYATLYALSRINGRPAFMELEMYNSLRKYFNLSLPVLPRSISSHIPWKFYHLNDWMQPEYSHFEGTFVRIFGYPTSWTFYHHLRHDIKREFLFRSEIQNDVNSYLKSIQKGKPSVTYIGVHVRRGDYVNLMKNRYDGVLADTIFLKKAMTYFRNRYSNCLFVICSDDLEWSKQNVDTSKGDVHFGWNGKSSTPGRDLALLSSCNHSIITIGSFGFWSAYLSGGETVYLTNFTRPGSLFLTLFKYNSTYLPEWKGIPANL